MAPLPAEMWKLLEDALNDPRSEAYEKLAAVPDATLETARALPGFSSHSFKQPLSQGLGETPLELHDSFLPSESSVLRSKRAAAASVGSPIATDQRKLARTESPSHQSPLAAPREPTDEQPEADASSFNPSENDDSQHVAAALNTLHAQSLAHDDKNAATSLPRGPSLDLDGISPRRESAQEHSSSHAPLPPPSTQLSEHTDQSLLLHHGLANNATATHDTLAFKQQHQDASRSEADAAPTADDNVRNAVASGAEADASTEQQESPPEIHMQSQSEILVGPDTQRPSAAEETRARSESEMDAKMDWPSFIAQQQSSQPQQHALEAATFAGSDVNHSSQSQRDEEANARVATGMSTTAAGDELDGSFQALEKEGFVTEAEGERNRSETARAGSDAAEADETAQEGSGNTQWPLRTPDAYKSADMPESASQEPNAAEEHKNPKDATSGGEQPRQEQMQQENCQRTLTGALPPENQQHSSQQASLQSAAIDEQNRPAHDPYWLRSVIISRLQVGDTLERWKSEKVSDEQVKQVLCAFTNSKRKR